MVKVASLQVVQGNKVMKKEPKDEYSDFQSFVFQIFLHDPNDSVGTAVGKSAVCKKSHCDLQSVDLLECDLQSVDLLERNLFAKQRSMHY